MPGIENSNPARANRWMVFLGLLVATILLGGVFAFRSAFEDAVRKHDRREATRRIAALREAIDHQIGERIAEIETYDPLALLRDSRARRALAEGELDEAGREPCPSGTLLRLKKVIPSRWRRSLQIFLWGEEEGPRSLIRAAGRMPDVVRDPRLALRESREDWIAPVLDHLKRDDPPEPGGVLPWRRVSLGLDGGATAYLVIETVSALDESAALTWAEPLSSVLLDLCAGAGFLQERGFSVVPASPQAGREDAWGEMPLDGLVTISSWEPGRSAHASPFDERGWKDPVNHHREIIELENLDTRLFLSVPMEELTEALAGTKDLLTLIGIFLACFASILLYAGGISVLSNKEASRRDPLTGLPNRRTFSAILDEEVSKAARYRRPLSMAVVDLDHFKTINDSLGHRAGDRVLSGAAKLLSDTLRRNDHIFRYGGEEFAILMPETDVLAAASALERVRAALESHRIPFGRGTVQVFASFGVTSYVQGETAEDLVVRADSACYAAKRQGRNRVVLLRRDHDAKTEIELTDMLTRSVGE